LGSRDLSSLGEVFSRLRQASSLSSSEKSVFTIRKGGDRSSRGGCEGREQG